MKGNFDYEQVNCKMEQLDAIFVSFMERLRTMDTKYKEGIAVGIDSALYGGKASLAKRHWEYLSRSFDFVFDKEFRDLCSTVSTIATNYQTMEDDVVDMVNNDTSSYYGNV